MGWSWNFVGFQESCREVKEIISFLKPEVRLFTYVYRELKFDILCFGLITWVMVNRLSLWSCVQAECLSSNLSLWRFAFQSCDSASSLLFGLLFTCYCHLSLSEILKKIGYCCCFWWKMIVFFLLSMPNNRERCQHSFINCKNRGFH